MFQFDGDAAPEHIGICLEPGTYIEGNTSAGKKGSQADGQGVYIRKRPDGQVLGYIALNR